MAERSNQCGHRGSLAERSNQCGDGWRSRASSCDGHETVGKNSTLKGLSI
jgi:hypothetical protein